MNRLVMVSTLLAVLAPRVAWACPVCFGASDGPLLRGSSMGILALLIVTLGMFGAFGVFFLHLRRRAAEYEQETARLAAPGLEGGQAR